MLEMKIPSPGESITEVVIAEWVKEDGDYVEIDETLCEIETDKATLPLPAEASGILTIVIAEGEEANVGDVICKIDTDAKAPQSATKEEVSSTTSNTSTSVSTETSTPPQSTYASGHPSPAAQKILAEKEVSSMNVQGTGKDGRITKSDAQSAIQPASSKTAPKVASEAPVISGSREVKRESMSRIRAKIAERVVAVKNETAMLTTFNEVDMTNLMALRSKYKDKFIEKFGVKLGFMSFFTKACTESLKEFPAINAMIDGKEIVFHDYIDMGIAVSAPKGLVVPVIRNAESMTIAEIEAEIIRLALKARDNKLSIEEMTGGTFSITNGGVFGSLMSTPIINPPQSAILGMHNIVQRPMVVNQEIMARPMMYVALSYDHRIIDGKESVSFLVKVKEKLEDPARMLLGV